MKKLYIFILVLLMLPFVSATLDDNLMSYYKFDESTGLTAVESVFMLYNGTSSNTNILSGTSGIINNASNFSASNYYISNIYNPQIATQNITVSFWIKQNGNTAFNTLIDAFNGSGGYRVRFETLNNLNVVVYGNTPLTSTGISIPSNVWTHIAFTYNTNTRNLSIYKNGNLTYSGTKADNAINPTGLSKIGSQFDNTLQYGGLFDELAIYERQLSNSEIIELYDAQKNGFMSGQYPFTDYFFIKAKDSILLTDINTFNATVNGVFFNTTNGTIFTSYNISNPFLANININSNGYFQKSYTSYITSSNLYAQLRQVGTLELNIKSQSTNNLITDLVNITIQSSTEEFNYQTSNGTYLLNDLILNENYNIFLNSLPYNNNQYAFTYTQNTADPYVMYMSTNTTIGEEITFQLKNTQNTAINNVLVSVEKFVNGSYQTISQKTTDLSGNVVFVLEQGITHKITFSKEGYVSEEFISQLSQTTYTIILDTSTNFDFTGVAGGVLYAYNPTSIYLQPSATQSFNFSVSSTASDIFEYKIRLYNGTTLLSTETGNNPTGGTVTLTYNTTPFNNSQIKAVYSFLKNNYTEYQINVYYTIQDISDESAFSVNEFMKNNVSIRDRIVIWSVIMLTIILIFSLAGNAITTILVASALAPFVAWLVGISSIIVGFFSALLIIGVISSRSSQ